MIEPFAAAFESDIEFERYVLSKATPLVPPDQGNSSATLYLDDRPTHITLRASTTLGRTNAQVLEELGLRPMLFAAAWKILDVLVEHTLWNAMGTTKRYTIEEKIKWISAGGITVRPLTAHPDLLARLGAAYSNAVEYRHSIVHRRVTVGPNGEFSGIDKRGNALRTFTADEQAAFCKMVQRVITCVTTGEDTPRPMARLASDLDSLTQLTGFAPMCLKTTQATIPTVTFPVHSSHEINMEHFKKRAYGVFPQSPEIDAVFQVVDRDGLRFGCELEAAPSERLFLDVDSPPPWLQRL